MTTVADAPEVRRIDVRPIRASDRAQWAELWHGYLAFYDTALPLEVYDTTFARLLERDPHGIHGLVADQGGTLIGLTHYLFHAHAWKTERVCYLQDLFAHPEHRGTGTGRKLIEAVYDAADAAGTPTVYWLTQEFNHTARRLYDRIGQKSPFIRYGRVLT